MKFSEVRALIVETYFRSKESYLKHHTDGNTDGTRMNTNGKLRTRMRTRVFTNGKLRTRMEHKGNTSEHEWEMSEHEWEVEEHE